MGPPSFPWDGILAQWHSSIMGLPVHDAMVSGAEPHFKGRGAGQNRIIKYWNVIEAGCIVSHVKGQ